MRNLDLTWQPALLLTELPAGIGEWLLDAGSFMQRLHRHGAKEPRIQVLQERWQMPLISEKIALGLSSRAYAFIREVLIYSQDKKWMFGRTVFPRETITGREKYLTRLKKRPLGTVLFNDPTTQRGAFELSCLESKSKIHAWVSQKTAIKTERFWARRSIFHLKNKPLLLTEIFLPDVESL